MVSEDIILADSFVPAAAYAVSVEERRTFDAFRRCVQAFRFSRVFTESTDCYQARNTFVNNIYFYQYQDEDRRGVPHRPPTYLYGQAKYYNDMYYQLYKDVYLKPPANPGDYSKLLGKKVR